MAYVASELMWIQSLLFKMSVLYNKLMIMYYDNQMAMYIANNPTFHERMKYIKVDATLSEAW